MTGATEGGPQGSPAPTGHSRFGASGAHRWLVCHGSIKAQTAAVAERPELNASSVYAQEGTDCHEVAALCLQNDQDAIEYTGRTIGETEIEEEHAEAIQVFLDAIRADKTNRGGKLLIETRFRLDNLHPEFFGTCDCARLGSDNVLSVYDLKMGKGKVVEVKTDEGGPNPQLGFYGLGALHSLARVVERFKVRHVELVVIQPRAPHRDGPVRRATFTVQDLNALGEQLIAAAIACEEESPAIVPGDHCTFCKAAGTCKGLRDKALAAAQLDFDDDVGVVKPWGERTVNPLTLTPQQIANALEAADLVETWVKAVRFHAALLLDSGRTPIPGWKLAERQARRKWEDDAKAAASLCYDFGLDENAIYGKKLKSPAQVEKLLPKPERELLKALNLYSAKSSGTTLARDTDPRKAASPSSQSDFEGGDVPMAEEW